MDIKQGIIELLKVLKQGIVEGKDLIVTQFPILCHQIIKWRIWLDIFQTGIFSIMIYISYRLIQVGFKKMDKSNDDRWLLLFVGGIIGIVFFSIHLRAAVYDLIKASFAPNLYVLLYLKEMINQK